MEEIILNFKLSDFLGIFLIVVPLYVFLTTILLRGINWIVEDFTEPDKKNIFHHHFHYKAGRPD